MVKRIFLSLLTVLLIAIPVFATGGGENDTASWVIGLIVGGIIFYYHRQSVLKNYGSEGVEKPYPFQEKATLTLTESSDVFLREHHTAYPKVQNHHRGGGHGGHGGGRH